MNKTSYNKKISCKCLFECNVTVVQCYVNNGEKCPSPIQITWLRHLFQQFVWLWARPMDQTQTQTFLSRSSEKWQYIVME
jgi:hypothetical protein